MIFGKQEHKTLYIVAGYIWEDGASYPIVTDHSVFSTYAKAKKEIKEIIKETKQDAEEMEYEIEIEWKNDFDTLEIKYPNTGTIENWVIYERTLDK